MMLNKLAKIFIVYYKGKKMTTLVAIAVWLIYIGIIIAVVGACGAYGGNGRIQSTKLSRVMFCIFCVLEVTGVFLLILEGIRYI